jgi:arylsulfatase
LAAWPDFLQRWDSLSEGEKRLFIRQANVYAAYLAYTDHQIGRVIAEVERQGQLDNTLIIYISGDNGSSAEGSLNGTPNEVMYFNGVSLEATRNQVFPLDMTALTRMIEPRPRPAAGRRQFVFTGPSCCTQANAAPNLLNRSYRITAEIEVPAGGSNGVLLTQGGRFGGWSLYLRDGRPVFTLNLLGMERVKWESTAALPPGRNSVVFDFALSPEGQVPFGHGGTGTLTVNGRQATQQSIPRSVPFTYAWDETFDVGRDTGTSVDDHEYQLPFDFTGQIARITVDLGESTVTPAAVRAFAEAMAARAAAARATTAPPTPASTSPPPRR